MTFEWIIIISESLTASSAMSGSVSWFREAVEKSISEIQLLTMLNWVKVWKKWVITRARSGPTVRIRLLEGRDHVVSSARNYDIFYKDKRQR